MIDLLLLKWLGKAGSETFLISSELLLLVFALFVAVGVFGETTKSARWQPWHHAFGIVVFIGVAGEMIADAGVFISSARLQEIQEGEVAKLNEVTEKLRASNLELIAKFAWRELDKDQQLYIANAVRRYAGTSYDTAISDEPESLNLLNQIVVALESAGWAKRHCNCGRQGIRDSQGRSTSVIL